MRNHCRDRIDLGMDIMRAKAMLYIAAHKYASTHCEHCGTNRCRPVQVGISPNFPSSLGKCIPLALR